MSIKESKRYVAVCDKCGVSYFCLTLTRAEEILENHDKASHQ